MPSVSCACVCGAVLLRKIVCWLATAEVVFAIINLDFSSSITLYLLESPGSSFLESSLLPGFSSPFGF